MSALEPWTPTSPEWLDVPTHGGTLPVYLDAGEWAYRSASGHRTALGHRDAYRCLPTLRAALLASLAAEDDAYTLARARRYLTMADAGWAVDPTAMARSRADVARLAAGEIEAREAREVARAKLVADADAMARDRLAERRAIPVPAEQSPF